MKWTLKFEYYSVRMFRIVNNLFIRSRALCAIISTRFVKYVYSLYEVLDAYAYMQGSTIHSQSVRFFQLVQAYKIVTLEFLKSFKIFIFQLSCHIE